MQKAMEKEWQKLLGEEEKYFAMAERKEEKSKNGKMREWSIWMQEKIPDKLVTTLNTAFNKAFYFIFDKGVDAIEKTFKGEEIALEFEVNDFRVDKKPTKKSIRHMDRAVKKGQWRNSLFTTAEGVGLGALGIGLPDIPIFLGMLLKGLYEMAAGFGFDYKDKKEQVLILRMIHAALSPGEEKRKNDLRVERWIACMEDVTVGYSLEEEVLFASEALSNAMLMAKFVQGFFLVGIAGGVTNPIIYKRVSEYAAMKYKKRYLAKKRRCE